MTGCEKLIWGYLIKQHSPTFPGWWLWGGGEGMVLCEGQVCTRASGAASAGACRTCRPATQAARL